MDELKGLHIRDARDDDRDAILDLTASAYQEYAALMGPEHWQMYRQDMEATVCGEVRADIIVAEQDGLIVGSALLYPAGTALRSPDGAERTLERPEVRLLAVSPAARGRGVGMALMEECLGRARRAGAAELTLHTNPMMQAAVRLYERMGFERAPELDFSPLPGVVIKGYMRRVDGAGAAGTAS